MPSEMLRTEPVKLNIYDMYWVNDYLSNLGIGVFHSGVEVYGVEYSYGGHPFECTGIFDNTPRDAEELGENFRFRETVELGTTVFTAAEVEQLVDTLSDEFRGDKYHLITKNCNHFAAHFAKMLCGAAVPGYINRLASISNNIPFLEKMLPAEWLTPAALQASLEHRRQSNAATMINNSNGMLFSPPSSSRNPDQHLIQSQPMSSNATPILHKKNANNNDLNGQSSRWSSLTNFFSSREGTDRSSPSSTSPKKANNHNPSLIDEAEDALTELERSQQANCTTGISKLFNDWKK